MAIRFSVEQRRTKLAELARAEGYEAVDDLIEDTQFDSVVPGICAAEGCDYTVGVEGDQDRGYCEACGERSVQSALILAGLI